MRVDSTKTGGCAQIATRVLPIRSRTPTVDWAVNCTAVGVRSPARMVKLTAVCAGMIVVPTTPGPVRPTGTSTILVLPIQETDAPTTAVLKNIPSPRTAIDLTVLSLHGAVVLVVYSSCTPPHVNSGKATWIKLSRPSRSTEKAAVTLISAIATLVCKSTPPAGVYVNADVPASRVPPYILGRATGQYVEE